MANETTTKFKVDISDLKAGIQEANRQIKLANAEFKAASSSMDNWSNSADGVSAKIKQLETVLQSENSKLENLKKQLELVEQEQGKNSKGADELRIAIANQQAAVNKTEKSLNGYKGKLEELSSTSEKQISTYDKLNQSIDKQEKELENLKKEYSNTVLEQGKNSKASKELAEKISQLSSELNENKSKISDADNAADELDDSLDDVSDSAKKSTDGFTVMKGALANLVSQGIGLVVEGFKNMISATKEAYESFDSGADIIIQKTGATGEAAAQLQGVYKNVTKSVIGDFEDIGTAVGEVNTRFGLTGDALEATSTKFLKFAELNGTDVNSSIDSVQKTLSAFGLSADEAGNVLDTFNAVGQSSGISMDVLSSSLMENANTFSQMGLNVHEAAGLLGEIEKSGITTQAALTGLSKASQYAAKENKPLSTVLSETATQMKNSKSESEALNIAYDVFGKKAGAKIYEACKTGSMSFDELAASMTNNMGSIDTTYENLQDGADVVKLAFQGLKADVGDSIASFLDSNKESIRNFTGSISEGLQEMVNGVEGGSEKFASGVSGLLTGIIDTIVGVLPSLIDVGVNIVTSLIQGFVQAYPQLITAITGAIPQLIESIVSTFDVIVQTLPTVVESIVSALPTLIPTLVNGLVSMMTSLLGNIQQIIQPIIDVLPSLIESIINAVVTNLPIIVTAITEALPPLIVSIVNAILTNLPLLIEGAIQLVAGIVAALPQIIMSLLEAVGGVALKIGEALFNALPGPVKEAFQAAWDAVKAIWDLVQPYFAVIWKGIKAVFSVVGSVLGGFFKTAWTAIKAIWDVVTSYFEAIWNTIKGIFSVVANVLKGNWSEAWEAIKSIVSGWVDYFKSIWEGIKSVFSAVVAWFGDVFQTAWDGIKSVWSAVTGFFSGIWDGIVSVFSSVGSWFSDIFSQAWEGIKSVWSSVKTFFTEKWNDITSVFSNAFDSFLSIGGNIVDGIKQGISNAWNNLKEWFSGLFDDLIGIAKKILGIASPSKVFKKIGDFIIQGLKVGLIKNKKKSDKAMTKVVNDVKDTAEDKKGFDITSDSKSNWAVEVGESINEGMATGIKNNADDVINALDTLVTDSRSEVEKVVNESNEVILESEQFYSDESLRIAKEKSDAEYAEKIANAKTAEELAQIKADEELRIQDEANNEYLENLRVSAELERKIYEAKIKDVQTLKSLIVGTYKTMASEVFSSIDELEQSEIEFASKLASFGDLTHTTTIKLNDGTEETFISLANIGEQTDTLYEYLDLLTAIKDRGELPTDFFRMIREMSVEDGMKFAKILLNSSDEDFDEYIRNWQEKQSAASEISKALYQDEAEALATEITGKFDAVENEFFGVGETSADLFEDGFLSQLNQVVENIKQAIVEKFSNLVNTSDFIPTGNTSSGDSTTELPQLASGGVLKRGQIGLLEGNGAEAVIPLENNSGWIRKTARDLKNQMTREGLLLSGNTQSVVNNNYNFTQNNTSPKALSRLEIYRQTKKQLNFVRGV